MAIVPKSLLSMSSLGYTAELCPKFIIFPFEIICNGTHPFRFASRLKTSNFHGERYIFPQINARFFYQKIDELLMLL